MTAAVLSWGGTAMPERVLVTQRRQGFLDRPLHLGHTQADSVIQSNTIASGKPWKVQRPPSWPSLQKSGAGPASAVGDGLPIASQKSGVGTASAVGGVRSTDFTITVGG